MTIRRDVYVDLKGREYNLAVLDNEERQLVAVLQKRAKAHVDWNEFDNFWLRKVSTFYDRRGFSRKKSMRTAVYEIAQDLSGRLAISLGLAREPDYRDELREIIRTRFKSQREFCEAAGLSEDMLSHVLAGRKHMGMDALTHAMERIGYALRIMPSEKTPSKKFNPPQEVA